MISSSKPRIVLTRRWPLAVESALRQDFDVVLNEADRPFSTSELKSALETADAVLPTVTDRISRDVIEGCEPRAAILANYGVGHSHIDIDAARARGIAVTNTPDVLSECTADLAITLMLMLARRTSEGERQVRTGAWPGWCPTHLLGTRVSDKTLGIIGYGRIGQEVAKRAHHGFGMRIVAYNRSPIPNSALEACNAIPALSLEELLGQADFVSLHCPGGGANRYLIGAEQLNQMKPSAYLINTARGEVVDENALVNALWFETIAGAGLDVYEAEPNVSAQLRNCDNVVLLPHLGSATQETRADMGFRVMQNLKAFFAGEQPQDLVA